MRYSLLSYVPPSSPPTHGRLLMHCILRFAVTISGFYIKGIWCVNSLVGVFHLQCWNGRIRTLVFDFGDRCSTIELRTNLNCPSFQRSAITRLPTIGLSPLLSVTVTLATACELFAGAVYFISKWSEADSNHRILLTKQAFAIDILTMLSSLPLCLQIPPRKFCRYVLQATAEQFALVVYLYVLYRATLH